MCYRALLSRIQSVHSETATGGMVYYCHGLFNRDINRGCLVYKFSLRFSGRNFLINLRRKIRVRKIFLCM